MVIVPLITLFQPSSSATHSSDAVCEQLQKEFPSSHIRQTFDRYCLLSSKAISCKEHLICSIPVVRTQDGVQVDDMALSRKEIAVNGESLPWTQVYAPTQASHVIGNHKAITTLLEWLQSWRGRKSNTKCSESVKRHVEMQEDPDFLPTKELAEDKEKTSDVSAVLLHGPHGSGKTAAVYACATQIGLKVGSLGGLQVPYSSSLFQVFEVHAGHLRSKSLLIQKLKEATLSHRVTPFSKTKFSSKSVGLGSNSVILFDEVHCSSQKSP